MVDYFTDNKNKLDDDSLVRLETNPLRILDSKNSEMKSLIANAPSISEYHDSESKDHFAQLTEILEHGNIKFTINSKLVRGLDYYGKTVYEWTTTELGTQDTVCAGGRYDNLIENHGSASVSYTHLTLPTKA